MYLNVYLMIKNMIIFHVSRIATNIGFHTVACISSTQKKKIGELNTAYTVDSFPKIDQSLAVDPFYDGCGVTKTCFGATDECLSKQDCSTVTTVTPEDSNYVFEMKTKNAAYVAVGLSNDQKMVRYTF